DHGEADVIATLWKLTSEEEHERLLEQRNFRACTVFLYAAVRGKADVIATLWELTSDEEHQRLLEQKDDEGNTAFTLAISSKHDETLEMLKQFRLPTQEEQVVGCLLKWLSGYSLATRKEQFINNLRELLSAENPLQLKRADILNIIFPLLKEGLISKTGPFAFISKEQGASRCFGLFKRALNENEKGKWHTRTYSLALGMLKDAYDALGNGVLDDTEEEKAFRSYVRGNNVFSPGQRVTRGGKL
ncbi:MAG: hypothetical protein HY939_03685, partial [Gammaproteobacteria bacterium]|nr:hypothetical protein [Gammaproteobacteria bacterium]